MPRFCWGRSEPKFQSLLYSLHWQLWETGDVEMRGLNAENRIFYIAN